jgi:hypothetical protein
MIFRTLFGAGLTLVLAACAATPPHNINVQDVRALQLQRLDVIVDPAAGIRWPDIAKDPSTANAAAALRLREQARTSLEPALKTTLAGSKPVIARMTVHGILVPSTSEVLLVGSNSELGVSVDFLDARTGATIMSYPRTAISTQGGYKLNMGTSGIISHDPVERMFADLNSRLTSWLLKS